eukprot:TRINITY_DN10891_c0_g1_i1.p1 TRINITY_DN10891_c0_g1~~TRINITY_DN10891_c0_g1_i1.p1  ORF type:complete len:509 (+),score=125.59 TRINITY_DN10891_c0_g1_i1:99-1625(+)
MGVASKAQTNPSVGTEGYKKKKHIEQIRTMLSYPEIICIYMAYCIILIFGLAREWVSKSMVLLGLKQNPFAAPKGYASLFKDLEYFWLRRFYQRCRDCFERPIASCAGTWIDVMDRTSPDENTSYQYTGTKSRVLNLGSYNYLGFAETTGPVIESVAESIQKYGVCSGSPTVEAGRCDVVEELEKMIADFVGKPAAIVFGMGYATNSTTIPTICGGRGTLIISDTLNHNSIVAGARDSGAIIRTFKHNNTHDLERVLRAAIVEGQPRTHRQWKKIVIIVEGIYSMEGEICALPEIVALKKKYKAYLYVDEAHSIGALGNTGRGVCEHWGVNPADIDILMGTFTKAFGSVGGYIAADKAYIDYMRKTSYGQIYCSSMSAPCAQQALAALKVIAHTEDGKRRIKQLHDNSNYFRSRLLALGLCVFGDNDSPVVPMMLFHIAKIAAVSRLMLERGLAVVVVGFPVTPMILSRVRFCISAGHTREDIDIAVNKISEVGDIALLKYDSYKVQE